MYCDNCGESEPDHPPGRCDKAKRVVQPAPKVGSISRRESKQAVAKVAVEKGQLVGPSEIDWSKCPVCAARRKSKAAWIKAKRKREKK